jgi:hypothetical protein
MVSFLLSFAGYAQLNHTTFEELDSLQRVAPRPVVVFIHTHWCKYCAALENTTLRHERVVALLNERYYFVSFDAEQREDIHLRGRTFSFQPSGHRQGIHELAKQLGTVDGAVAYPTLCVLNADYEIVFQHNQFMSASDLSKALISIPAMW